MRMNQVLRIGRYAALLAGFIAAAPTASFAQSSIRPATKSGPENVQPAPPSDGKIHYVGSDNLPHTAYLDKTDVSLPGWPFGQGWFQSTHDPDWIDKADGSNEAKSPFLLYHADDNRLWKVTVQCSYQYLPAPAAFHGDIICNFKHEGNGEDHVDQRLRYIDARGDVWQANINPVPPPFPAYPQFSILFLCHGQGCTK